MYEYKVLRESELDTGLWRDARAIEWVLNNLASEGWRVIEACSHHWEHENRKELTFFLEREK